MTPRNPSAVRTREDVEPEIASVEGLITCTRGMCGTCDEDYAIVDKLRTELASFPPTPSPALPADPCATDVRRELANIIRPIIALKPLDIPPGGVMLTISAAPPDLAGKVADTIIARFPTLAPASDAAWHFPYRTRIEIERERNELYATMPTSARSNRLRELDRELLNYLGYQLALDDRALSPPSQPVGEADVHPETKYSVLVWKAQYDRHAKALEDLLVALAARWYPENKLFKAKSGDIDELILQLDNATSGADRVRRLSRPDAQPTDAAQNGGERSKVNTQVWTAARDMCAEQKSQPEWLWFKMDGRVTFGRWSGEAGQAPYVRADIAVTPPRPADTASADYARAIENIELETGRAVFRMWDFSTSLEDRRQAERDVDRLRKEKDALASVPKNGGRT